jgi:hypothetical protein
LLPTDTPAAGSVPHLPLASQLFSQRHESGLTAYRPRYNPHCNKLEPIFLNIAFDLLSYFFALRFVFISRHYFFCDERVYFNMGNKQNCGFLKIDAAT